MAISFTEEGKTKYLIPLTVLRLMNTKACIAWPCTTCGGQALERETINQLKLFLEKESLEPNKGMLKKTFIDAMFNIDMKSMTALNETTDTSTAPYSGSYLSYWRVYLRNIAKNDISKKSERLTFNFDYKEIYNYWINNRLDEIDLVDFMIFYNQYVPDNLRRNLYEAGEKLNKNNEHKSLGETLEYKKNDFQNFL